MTDRRAGVPSPVTDEEPPPGGVKKHYVAAALGIACVISLLLEAAVELASPLGMLPWVAAVAVVFVVPLALQWRRGRFDPFTPAAYPVWTYLAPVFFGGSLLLWSGVARQPMLPGLIPEPETRYFCLALGYVGLGWAALLIGYYSGVGSAAGATMQRWLPTTNWRPDELGVPAAVLLVIGVGCVALAFRSGLIGYQRPAEVGPYDALISYASGLALLAVFLLWLALFATPAWRPGQWILAAALLLFAPAYLVATASRAALLSYLLVVAGAYRFAGRAINAGSIGAFVVMAAFSLAVGTGWSTAYRVSRGTEATGPELEAAAQAPRELIGETLRSTAQRGISGNTSFVARNLAARLEITSSVAVVVANYRRLRTEEERHGIADNIWRETWTALVPRGLWPEKPIVSDARTYSLVYFGTGDTSYALTPMGDLLRNFGPLGVVLGMALLGCGLRAWFRLLVEDQALRVPRTALYLAVLMSISYEGFFGPLLPGALRIGAVTVAGLALVHALVVWRRRVV